MVHANAPLTPRGRLLLAQLIVDDGWPIVRAAEHFNVSWPTAKRWAVRYLEMGEVGMVDRSSRPHHSPNRTPEQVKRKIVDLRWRTRLSPLAIASRLNMPASTVHAVLVRCRLNRLSHIDIRTGEVIRRYEHPHPGSMIHVDVKKLGNIPDGGGWRFVGRAKGRKNRQSTPGTTRSRHHNELLGHAFVHTVIDDHSRVAYAEIHDDETATTAVVAVLRRAVSWFAARGVTVERVLSDNGGCYRSTLWKQTCAELAVKHKRTRPYRPQTNGKIERFHRTLAAEWAFARHYKSERTRRSALPAWLHTYNHHRQHSAIGRNVPFSRLTNVPGQYS
ncbi:transposase IS481 family protein [Rhodococcus sp. OK611]|uniref:IS481 family transposase n=1 Tax=unclassified Rhodococcus (in: high G+C Gram-positive bacteria) TaxID=192944 RepID=UPI000BCA33DA|nr:MULTISPECIES: IS481 family transposase [unclassified Rhodococcus (in: high G+C Gram-positive bacteria)]PTR44504.1 transposase IS481 family protein [Rhodococcus sp. OK611]SNX89945.1 leucine-zipper of insertion element IS481 [Rhodococcus sp. OK270]